MTHFLHKDQVGITEFGGKFNESWIGIPWLVFKTMFVKSNERSALLTLLGTFANFLPRRTCPGCGWWLRLRVGSAWWRSSTHPPSTRDRRRWERKAPRQDCSCDEGPISTKTNDQYKSKWLAMVKMNDKTELHKRLRVQMSWLSTQVQNSSRYSHNNICNNSSNPKHNICLFEGLNW